MNDEEIREKLNPEEYRVMRKREDENAYSGRYYDATDNGVYLCTLCNNLLFLSHFKFDAKDGFPAFHRPMRKKNIVVSDESLPKEVSCAKCGSHLGYVMDEKEKHYRINSIALRFEEYPELEWEEEDGEREEKKDTSNNAQTASSAGKTITLTIGGISIGIAGGLYAGTALMPNDCPIPQTIVQQVTTSGSGTVNIPPRGSGITATTSSGTPPQGTATSSPAENPATPAESSADGTGVVPQ